jgi:transcriptional regulator with PAS, ATPase and Fis domain
MPYHLQAKLLRALQEREIRRLGSDKSIKIDVRVISATNANLQEKIKKGEFREDLYYRLNTIPLNIPPLRERKEEIIQIASKVLEQNCKKYGFELKSFSAEAIKQLQSYEWPGNIRELISVVERAVILSEGNKITSEDLFLESRGLKKENSIEEMEKNLIKEVLSSNDSDIEASAKTLGMSKTNLLKKIKHYNI